MSRLLLHALEEDDLDPGRPHRPVGVMAAKQDIGEHPAIRPLIRTKGMLAGEGEMGALAGPSAGPQQKGGDALHPLLKDLPHQGSVSHLKRTTSWPGHVPSPERAQ